MKVNPIPEGFSTLTPYFATVNAASLIEFLKKAFNATEQSRLQVENGLVMNAQLKIGNSVMMVGECPDAKMAVKNMIYLYVENSDQAYDLALKAGAKAIVPMTDQFYGDRVGAVEDDHGNKWWIASRREEVSAEELKKRAKNLRPKV